MFTDFLRDALFTTAWFGLMTCVWFGWAQENPPRHWRKWLGIGSTLGTLCAFGFGAAVVSRWSLPSALEGQYHWFGVLVTVEVLLAGAGCGYLAMSGRGRWMAWWVALIIAVHFLPLGWMLWDVSVAVAGVIQLASLIAIVPPLKRHDRTTSALVGAVMGATLLAYAVISGIIALPALIG